MDPTLTWARSLVLQTTIKYWGGTNNSIPRSITEAPVTKGKLPLITSGVLRLEAAVASSWRPVADGSPGGGGGDGQRLCSQRRLRLERGLRAQRRLRAE